MISVCMATCNGAKYIMEQIESILPQLGENDELVVSDDHSTDDTVKIIQGFGDRRIKLYENTLAKGVTHNFENAMRQSHGNILFLADQDDVWLPGKLKEMSEFLTKNHLDVVTCDCALTDSNLNIVQPSYYANGSPLTRSAWGNLLKDLWLGSCTCFTRKVFEACSPFPRKAAAHDLWMMLFCQLHFKCGYYPKVLQYYRRHDATVSFAGEKSTNDIAYRIKYRLYILYHLIIRSLKKNK